MRQTGMASTLDTSGASLSTIVGPAGISDAEHARRTRMLEQLHGGGAAEFVDVVLESARHAGDRVLFTDRRRTWTGHQVGDAIIGTVQAFHDEGMRRGDVVLLGARPGIEAMLVLLGCMRNGATCTVIDPGAGQELFARRLELMQPSWVIAETLIYTASARTPLRAWTRSKGLELPHLSKIAARHIRIGPWAPGSPTGAVRFRSRIRRYDDLRSGSIDTPRPDPSDVAAVFFTSGTTGHPKGVQHTGRSVCAAIRMMLEIQDLPSDTVFYNHNLHSYVATIIAGVTTKIAPLKMVPHRYAQEVAKAGATHAFIRPVDAFNLVIECEQKGVRFPQTLRHMYFYSAPVTTTVLKRVLAAAHPDLKIHCIYGMTEASAVAIVDGAERAAWTGEGDLVGKAVPGVEVRVNEAGVLMVRGDNVHRGYAGMEQVEWHDTGDSARIDNDGNIILGGRAKDMLIRGHFNLYPSLYEETIARIPGVRACAIVGVADPVTADEAVHLYVEPDPLAPDPDLASTVEAALRSGPCMIDIAARPDAIHVLDELPKSGRANKVDRHALRALAATAPAGAGA